MKTLQYSTILRNILIKTALVSVYGLGINFSYAQDTASYHTIEHVAYYPGKAIDSYIQERCELDIYYPTNIENYPTVVWFHGGGLTGGNKFIPQELKNQGVAVVAVNYRLSPRATAPAYIQDAAAAIAWVFKHIENYGGDPSKVFVAGHSAGGYLVAMVGLDKQWLAQLDIDANDIAGIIDFSGHAITHMTIRQERGIPDHQPVVDSLAPLFHVRADAAPLVLVSGDRNMELLGRYEETAYFYRMMKVAGHRYTELFELGGFDHGAMAVPGFHILLNHIKTHMSMSKK